LIMFDINKSAYVKTLWCCAGHLQRYPLCNSTAYLVLVTENQNVDLLIRMIRSVCRGKLKIDNGKAYKFAYNITVNTYGECTTINWWTYCTIKDHLEEYELDDDGKTRIITSDIVFGDARIAMKKLSQLILRNNWKNKFA
jgi:hypothetical protein